MSYRLRRAPGVKGGIFRDALADDAPLAPTSANYVARLNRQRVYRDTSSPIKGTVGSDFFYTVSISSQSIPIYRMAKDHPTGKVNFRRTDGTLVSDSDPLSQAWMNVPIPILEECRPGLGTNNNSTTAKDHQIESNGRDRSVCFLRGNELWEFWRFREDSQSPSGWCAAYGGYTPNIYATQGMYRNGWGITASGTCAPCTRVTWEDVERQEIDHALSLAIPNTGLGTSTPTFVSPAIRGDSLALGLTAATGVSSATFTAQLNADKLPHGTRFRLPADFDVEGWADDSVASQPLVNRSLHVAVMNAIKKYGVYIMDSTQGTFGWGWEDSRTILTPYSPFTAVPAGGWHQNTKWAFAKLPYQHFQQVAVPVSPWSRQTLVSSGGSVKKIRLT